MRWENIFEFISTRSHTSNYFILAEKFNLNNVNIVTRHVLIAFQLILKGNPVSDTLGKERH
jgi:hypothetical protein